MAGSDQREKIMKSLDKKYDLYWVSYWQI